MAIRASTFAIVIVAGRASNKLRTRFAELSRHITRRMTTIPMEEKIPPARPILIQRGNALSEMNYIVANGKYDSMHRA